MDATAAAIKKMIQVMCHAPVIEAHDNVNADGDEPERPDDCIHGLVLLLSVLLPFLKLFYHGVVRFDIAFAGNAVVYEQPRRNCDKEEEEHQAKFVLNQNHRNRAENVEPNRNRG